MFDIDKVIEISKLHPKRIKAIFLFGSRVYQTHNQFSDYDFYVIANTSYSDIEIKEDNYNIHINSPDVFLKRLKSHHPGAIECFYSPKNTKVIYNFDMSDFTLNEITLRHAFAHYASNSWVKAKKKLEQGDYNIGIKSLFHSLRILDFGIQLAKFDNIEDFTSSNHIYEKLCNKHWSWAELNEEFKPLRNKLSTEFRLITKKI